MSGAPIMIPCEGSGGGGTEIPVVFLGGDPGSAFGCQMCGRWFSDSPIPEHDRDDILARIDRGDFG